MRFINAFLCKFSDHRLQQSDRQVSDWKLAVAYRSRYGRQTVRLSYEDADKAGLVPEPACKSGQAFVSHVLNMVPFAIPVALGFVLLLLTGYARSRLQ